MFAGRSERMLFKNINFSTTMIYSNTYKILNTIDLQNTFFEMFGH